MAAAAKNLRVVKADEKAPKRKTQTVSVAAEGGDRLDLLLAMRARIAKAVENVDTPARDLAALTRRLLEIAKEVEVLEAARAEAEVKAGAAADESFSASAI